MSVFSALQDSFCPNGVLVEFPRLFRYDHWNLLWLRLNLCFPIRLLNIQPISDVASNCHALRLMPRLVSLRCDVTGQLFLSVELR